MRRERGWKLREHRVYENFDAVDREDYQGWRAADAGLETVTLWRTEYARWDDPDAAEPDKLGVLGVVWELVESGCECGSESFNVGEEDDGPCVCDSIADALGGVLSEWDVHATSLWEPSASPDWQSQALGTVWVSAHESYEHERDTRYNYSLHVEGVSAEIRSRIFGAVGVE